MVDRKIMDLSKIMVSCSEKYTSPIFHTFSQQRPSQNSRELQVFPDEFHGENMVSGEGVPKTNPLIHQNSIEPIIHSLNHHILPYVSPFQSLTGWWLGTLILFFHSVGNVIIPTDELIFFRGVGIPPTR